MKHFKSNDINDIIFTFSCYQNMKWDIKISDESLDNNIYDNKSVYSMTLEKRKLDLCKIWSEYDYINLYSPQSFIKYQTQIPPINIDDKTKYVKENLITKVDSLGKIYNIFLKKYEKIDSIAIRPFNGSISIKIYHLISKHMKNIVNKNTKVCIIGTNTYCADGVLAYLKKNHNVFDGRNIRVVNMRDNKKHENFNPYFNENKIKYDTINIIGENNLDKIEKINMDLAIIDLYLFVDKNTENRSEYSFQFIYSMLLYTIKNINKNGSIILSLTAQNTMIFNFISYLSCFFESVQAIDSTNEFMVTSRELTSTFIVFKKIKDIPKKDMDMLDELYNTFYNIDPSCGHNYFKNNKHINNIISINDAELKKDYDEYKEYSKALLLGVINEISNRIIYATNDKNITYKENIINENRAKAIKYAKMYDIPIVEWLEKSHKKYYDDFIMNNFKLQFDHVSVFDSSIVNPQDIKIYNNIECPLYDKLNELYTISESAYMYIDKTNYDAYKNVELFINNCEKNLNRLLLDKYTININGHVVSRAWIKCYELLFDTQILNTHDKDEWKTLFICEAPGNFVNSMNHYIKTNTKIKNHKWTAQSLCENKANFYDSYGFIKQTQKNWDLGPKEDGDIMNFTNFKYYCDKYNDVNMIMSDCGDSWSYSDITSNKNLSCLQLLYALLLPSIGGNFVIKTFSTNNNKLYLSLLYLTTCYYKKVCSFKSNANMWSAEIYIVGMDKIDMPKNTKETIMNIAEKVCNEDANIYPLESIPETFVEKYYDMMNSRVMQMADTKKMFTFLAQNTNFFEEHKKDMKRIIDDINTKWMNIYIPTKLQ